MGANNGSAVCVVRFGVPLNREGVKRISEMGKGEKYIK